MEAQKDIASGISLISPLAKNDNSFIHIDNSSKVITLRPIQPSDIDDFMVWASDNRVSRYTRLGRITSRDEALDFIKNYAVPHPWFRVICVGNNRPIGSVSVTPNPQDGVNGCRAELSLVMSFEYWGKGIAVEVARTAASYIFKEWSHLERLEAFVAPENEGAQKGLEKAGFLKEGLLRKLKTNSRGESKDLVVFSLLSSEARMIQRGNRL